MKDKILSLSNRLNDLNDQLADPNVHQDQRKYQDLAREHSELTKIMEIGEPYLKVMNDYEGNKAIIEDEQDEEFVEMAKAEMAEMEEAIKDYEEKLKLLLLPKDPDDHKNVIVEFAPVRVVMKPLFLPVISTECTPVIARQKNSSMK